MYRDVCAIIVTYNFDDNFNKCIESIEKQVDHIIVVDNNSNQNCIEMLESLSKKENISVIFNKINEGIAKAINIGVEDAIVRGYKWILTLDDDSEAVENMIKKMIEVYTKKNDPNIGIVAPNIYDLNIRSLMTNNQCEYEYINKCIQSGCMIKSDIFKKIGMFNEELFIYYVDDEFCERAVRKGYKILRANKAILNHRDGLLVKRKLLFKEFNYNQRSNLSIYYRTRNNIYMSRFYNKKYIIENLKDIVKIVLYSEKKLENLKSYFKGIKDSINNNYGICKEIHKN